MKWFPSLSLSLSNYLDSSSNSSGNNNMGGTFSAEDRLFASLRWNDLLAYSEQKKGVDPVFLELAASQPNAAKALNEARSFTEWFSLLTALQGDSTALREASVTCSELVRFTAPFYGDGSALSRLTQFPLRCGIIPIVVYMLAWWRGALSQEELTQNIIELEVYQNEFGMALNTVVAEDLAVSWEEEAQEGESESCEPKGNPSRRERLVGAVRRLRDLATSDKLEDAGHQEKQRGDGCAMTQAAIQMLIEGVVDRRAGDDSDFHAAGRASLKAIWAGTGDDCVLLTCAALIHSVYVIMVNGDYGLAVLATKRLRELHARLANTSNEPSGRTGSRSDDQHVVNCRRVLEDLETCLVMQQLSALPATQYTDALHIRQMFSHFRSIRASSPSPALGGEEAFEARWQENRGQYIGQEHIWSSLYQHFTTMAAFGEEAEKPTVIVLFGPSGLGKSELAKRLACALHSVSPSDAESSGKLVHIHMPSFCTNDSIYSLVDPPAAHVGDGILLSALMAHPDAVVVLDEFEKSTTSAVQHLWLSAFQKNGMLRSLKNAARSVSTVKTTFVLTCNTVADSIAEDADVYLNGTSKEKSALRDSWIAQCRQHCTAVLGAPFVNRVDFFFPVIPYTKEERDQFVVLQLDPIIAAQAAKKRWIAVAPSCVSVLANQLDSFHAPTVELSVKPLLLKMIHHHWEYAVLAAVQRMSSAVLEVDIFPVERVADDSGGSTGRGFEEGMEVKLRWCATARKKRSLLDLWFSQDEAEGRETGVPPFTAASPEATCTTPPLPSPAPPSPLPATSAAAVLPVSRPPLANDRSLVLELQVATEREVEMKRTVHLLTEGIKVKEFELDLLKKKVTRLETSLKLALCCCFAPILLLVLVTNLKLTLVYTLLTSLALAVYVLRIPLAVLWNTVKYCWSHLTPSRFFLLCGLLILMWSGKQHLQGSR